jgi:hypothetical protein
MHRSLAGFVVFLGNGIVFGSNPREKKDFSLESGPGQKCGSVELGEREFSRNPSMHVRTSPVRQWFYLVVSQSVRQAVQVLLARLI